MKRLEVLSGPFTADLQLTEVSEVATGLLPDTAELTQTDPAGFVCALR